MKNRLPVLLVLLSLLCACGSVPKEKVETAPPAVQGESGSAEREETMPKDVSEAAELFCLADSQEEAKAVAAQYGIELVDYSFGVATFHTDRDPRAVVEEGLRSGWKELSVNHTAHAMG